jgi:hypothetical protein
MIPGAMLTDDSGPSVASYVCATLGLIVVAVSVVADVVILVNLLSGVAMTEPDLRTRWSGIEFAGWAAIVPLQLFAVMLVYFNWDASADLLGRLRFRLRWLWLSMTGR